MISFNFSKEQKIEFRDVNDLSCLLYTHSVVPRKPGQLGVVAPSTLLYEDESQYNTEIHYLDLDELHTKPMVQGKVIHTEEEYILDMCFDAHKQLLVGTTFDGGTDSGNELFAYNIETGGLEWNFLWSTRNGGVIHRPLWCDHRWAWSSVRMRQKQQLYPDVPCVRLWISGMFDE